MTAKYNGAMEEATSLKQQSQSHENEMQNVLSKLQETLSEKELAISDKKYCTEELNNSFAIQKNLEETLKVTSTKNGDLHYTIIRLQEDINDLNVRLHIILIIY